MIKHSHATAYTPMKTILKHTFNIKKRWQECKEELYKKDLHDPDNHNGVITHLEPDILECKVKWALESISMNKASGSDGIPVELFQILKDDADIGQFCDFLEAVIHVNPHLQYFLLLIGEVFDVMIDILVGLFADQFVLHGFVL